MPAIDAFQTYSTGLSDTISITEAVTPSGTVAVIKLLLGKITG